MKKFVIKSLYRNFFVKSLGNSQRYTITKNKSIFAFTLSEVLITLSVIGIVAVITIPILNNNIQERQFKEMAKEAYSKASQVVQQMVSDCGGKWCYGGSTSIYPAVTHYFKVAKTCPGYSCVPSSASSTIYKSLHGDAANTGWMVSAGSFVTIDGMFWGFDDAWSLITVDVNGYTKSPNVLGKDVFMFEIMNNILIPMGTKGTASTFNKCDKTTSSAFQGYGCMYNVMQGIDY